MTVSPPLPRGQSQECAGQTGLAQPAASPPRSAARRWAASLQDPRLLRGGGGLSGFARGGIGRPAVLAGGQLGVGAVRADPAVTLLVALALDAVPQGHPI